MARKTSKFMIGLFVTIGVLIGVIAIVWLGASKYFEKGNICVTFFNESVQGLQVDSTVKYRGVEVGRVEKIRVAPDNILIEVVMKINLAGQLERDYVAQLKAVGITGIVFIELDRIEPGEATRSPRIHFAADHPVIPSKPSDISQIVSGVQEILEKIKQVDTKGISDKIKSTLTGFESMVANLNRAVRSVEKTLTAGRLEDALVEVKTTLVKIQSLTSDIQGELNALNLAKTGAHLENTTARIEKILTSGEVEAILTEAKGTIVKMNQLVEGVDKRSRGVTQNLKVTSENLKRASESLEMLIERVYASPSDLLFGRPPPPRREKK
jgi:phospholipid/cholesterol/gamma-HCH transport system substrate-binding protein